MVLAFEHGTLQLQCRDLTTRLPRPSVEEQGGYLCPKPFLQGVEHSILELRIRNLATSAHGPLSVISGSVMICWQRLGFDRFKTRFPQTIRQVRDPGALYICWGENFSNCCGMESWRRECWFRHHSYDLTMS
ncbi:hypothetical protein AVEN_10674-1 [Araneus ventricosus]|uniref:Uncharacterized protein n=1 Tax=Araneus ventricosus TaxID=182803 RepID=A0A4Y2ESV7_ARAVE|nr:hypothetical protein AVEN_10674-1 [Araneus ventricosus]